MILIYYYAFSGLIGILKMKFIFIKLIKKSICYLFNLSFLTVVFGLTGGIVGQYLSGWMVDENYDACGYL